MRSQVTIGISGVQPRAGCTHTCIMMANFLRGKGCKVALVEINNSGAFEDIRVASKSKLSLAKFFKYNDIDYYPFLNKGMLKNVMSKEYEFIIVDFGFYKYSHKPVFYNCDASIFVCGTKPWEINNLNTVFEDIDQDSLNNYYYYFTFSANNQQIQNDIRKGMDYAEKNLFFPPYVENPFTQGCFPGLVTIISDILSKDAQPNRRKHLFGRSNELLDITDKLHVLIGDKAVNKGNTGLQDDMEDIENIRDKRIPKITLIETEYDIDEENDKENESILDETSLFENETINQNTEDNKIQINDNLFNKSGFTELKDNEEPSYQEAKEINYDQRSYEIEQNAKNHFRDILLGDNTPTSKIIDHISSDFNIHNFKKESENFEKKFQKYEYTNEQAANIIFESKECMRKSKFVDMDNKDLVLKLSNELFNDTFCMAIRSGMKCSEKTSKKTGAPILSVKVDEKEIFCGKEDIVSILGEEFWQIPLSIESEV